ncbi:Uncharacterised protein [Mycobacteroides abscessus subsp. abscessus]|nr:Uncharacterised protein [Mycobacteroides abscessus subsp. abscessus]
MFPDVPRLTHLVTASILQPSAPVGRCQHVDFRFPMFVPLRWLGLLNISAGITARGGGDRHAVCRRCDRVTYTPQESFPVLHRDCASSHSDGAIYPVAVRGIGLVGRAETVVPAVPTTGEPRKRTSPHPILAGGAMFLVGWLTGLEHLSRSATCVFCILRKWALTSRFTCVTGCQTRVSGQAVLERIMDGIMDGAAVEQAS